MKKFVPILYVISFIGIISSFGIFSILKEDESISALENRELAQFPEWSWKAVWSGEYAQNIESYVTDQLVGRSEMVELYDKQQSLLFESSLKIGNSLSGFLSQNKDLTREVEDGVVTEEIKKVGLNSLLVNKEWVISIFSAPFNQEGLDESIANLNALTEHALSKDIEVFFVSPPYRYFGLWHMYPAEYQFTERKKEKDYFLSQVNEEIKVIDLLPFYKQFSEAEMESFYFKTDHHWNMRGAFFTYQTAIEEMSKRSTQFEDEPLQEEDVNIVEVPTGFFKGSINNNFRFVSAERLQQDQSLLYLPTSRYRLDQIRNSEGELISDLSAEFGILDEAEIPETYTYGNLYSPEKPTAYYYNELAKNDVHLLVLKDSYFMPLLPFFVQHFKEVTVIDVRYHESISMTKVIDENDFDMMMLFFHDNNLQGGSYLFEK